MSETKKISSCQHLGGAGVPERRDKRQWNLIEGATHRTCPGVTHGSNMENEPGEQSHEAMKPWQE